MKRLTAFIIILTVSAILSTCSQDRPPEEKSEAAGDTAGPAPGAASGVEIKPGQVKLPDYLLVVLRTEMRQLEVAMGKLLSNLAQGNPEAAEVAQNIHNSFILKQELSETDLKKLVSLLPEEFLKLDRGFHATAKKLVESVHQNEFNTAIQLYGEMAQTCVACHTRYASERFPAFANSDHN